MAAVIASLIISIVMNDSYRKRFRVDETKPVEFESGDRADDFLGGNTGDETLDRLASTPFELGVEYSGAGGRSDGKFGTGVIDGAGTISGLGVLSIG